MSNFVYTIGDARRFIAGYSWCAQAKNAGKIPCLNCRGAGTISMEWCPDCSATGWGDPVLFEYWLKIWNYTKISGKRLDPHLGKVLAMRGAKDEVLHS